MRRRTTMIAGLAAVAAVVGCSAGSGGDPAAPKTQELRVGIVAEPRSLDFTQDDGAAIPQALLVNVYEGLVELTPEGEIVPALAKSWKISDDRKVYTFELHDNVRFSNGAKFTAEDAVFSINRVKTDWKPAVKAGMDVVDTAEAVDDDTLRVTLKQPSNSWLFSMTTRIGAIFSRTGVDDLATEPVGTGPFVVQRWQRGSQMVLTANEKYWGKRPPLDKVTMRYFKDPTAMNSAMRSGGIDVISSVQAPESLSQFRDESKYQIIEGTTNGEVVLSFNHSSEPLKDKRVRQAIKYALDHEAILDTAWAGHGELIGSMVPPTDPWYEDLTGLYPHDPAKARALLAQAGRSNLTLRLRIPNLPYAVASAQVVQSQLRDVGIEAKIEELEFPDRWLDEVFSKADYDLSIISHVEPRDITRWADSGYYWRYDNPQVRKL
ncbi:MAG TPA: ABC transporter substrate-binding protein, partial [Actinopolymorphaceae bacterium]